MRKNRFPKSARVGAKLVVGYIMAYMLVAGISPDSLMSDKPLYHVFFWGMVLIGAYIVLLFIIGVYNVLKDDLGIIKSKKNE